MNVVNSNSVNSNVARIYLRTARFHVKLLVKRITEDINDTYINNIYINDIKS